MLYCPYCLAQLTGDFVEHLSQPHPRHTFTAGAESIATLSEKTAGTKFEISTLRNMIETSGFFHCTHLQQQYKGEKKF